MHIKKNKKNLNTNKEQLEKMAKRAFDDEFIKKEVEILSKN